jgi:hypothetical protein
VKFDIGYFFKSALRKSKFDIGYFFKSSLRKSKFDIGYFFKSSLRKSKFLSSDKMSGNLREEVSALLLRRFSNIQMFMLKMLLFPEP